MSTTAGAIEKAIEELIAQRSRIDVAIVSLEEVKKDLSAAGEQPQKKTSRRRQPTESKKVSKVRYTASQTDIAAVLEHADEPMTTFKIVEALAAEANVKVTEPALLKVLKLGERNEKFHQPEDGKWTLAQDE